MLFNELFFFQLLVRTRVDVILARPTSVVVFQRAAPSFVYTEAPPKEIAFVRTGQGKPGRRGPIGPLGRREPRDRRGPPGRRGPPDHYAPR